VSVLARGGTALPQGLDWDYSNYNYSLLGLAIEKATGKDYARAVRDEIAAPLGLKGTGYCEDGTMVPGRGRDYLSAPRSLTPTGYWAEAKFFAAGGLCSTVVDLARFASALETGHLISAAMLQAMRAPAQLQSGLVTGYGLGTRMGFTGGHRKLGHTGGGQSNKAVLARYPDDDLTVVVLLNTERPAAPITATEIEEQIEDLFFSGPGLAPASNPPAGSLARYAGEYRGSASPVRVSVDGTALVVKPGVRHRASSRLLPSGGDTFTVEDDPSYEIQFAVADEAARGYRRYHNGWFVGLAARADRD
jgi:CubicO group peptidase (beta-lactamase class C family)